MIDFKVNISIVDDDESVRRALRRLLKSAGYEVRAFASARDFLENGAEDNCLLILDIQMPGMDGFELHEALTASGRKLPVIFISAHESHLKKATAERIGAVAFLQKPFDDMSLLSAIKIGIGAFYPAYQKAKNNSEK